LGKYNEHCKNPLSEEQLQTVLDQTFGIEQRMTQFAICEVGGVHYLRFVGQIAAQESDNSLGGGRRRPPRATDGTDSTQD